MSFNLFYKDGHKEEILLFTDEMFNTLRYINLTKEVILRPLFPNIGMAVKELLKYSDIVSVEYEGHNYNVVDFVRMFYFYEEVKK